MNRITLLDGFRGLFIVFMLLNHLSFTGGFALGWLNYSHFAFLESAQGFIFISGLLVGLVYMRTFQRHGPAMAGRRLSRRALQLYGWHVALILTLLVLARLIVGSDTAWGPWLGQLYQGSAAYPIAAGTLLYQPTYMDILPQYIIYLLVSPLVLLGVATERIWLVAALSAGAWLSVQLGLHLPLVEAAQSALSFGAAGMELRAHFNPLAWQIVFIPGVVIGALLVRGEFAAERLFTPERTQLVRVALCLLLFFLGWRLAFAFGWVGHDLLLRFQMFERRNEFGPIYLITFLAAGYAFAWMLVAGPASHSVIARTGARWTGAVLAHPYVMLLGRHSLPVYAFHVFLIYALKLLDVRLGTLADPLTSLLGLASIGLLAVPALLIERMRLPRAATPAAAT